MLVQPARHRLQFAADLVRGEKIEYAYMRRVNVELSSG